MGDERTKLLWHSNAPHVPTGYGQQTALFLPYLAEDYDVACSSFFGLEGAPIVYEGIPVLPGLGGEFGNSTLPRHAERFFGGDKRGGIVITLCDVWPLDKEMAASLNMACWVPVDHEPAPPMVIDFLANSEAIPIAMSRFGEAQLAHLDPLYVPHGVDTSIYKPLDITALRGKSFPEGAFVCGMVAANKGRPSRKAFAQSLLAFAKFASHHEDAFLYLHTVLDPNNANGENIPQLLKTLGIPEERIRIADQYSLMHEPYKPRDMAQIYSSLSVLLNPSYGEGFGIPVIEAAACGVPAIVTDFTAMREVCGAGWQVKYEPYWTGLSSWQAAPLVDDIVSALEECHALRGYQREKLGLAARRHAVRYDVQRVYKTHWRPAMRIIEQRFAKRTPLRIAARKVAA